MPEHPYFLLFALVVTLSAISALARFFFKNLDQFIEDAGLSSEEEIWLNFLGLPHRYEVGVFHGKPGQFLDVVGFLFSCASLFAAAYHIPFLTCQWFGWVH